MATKMRSIGERLFALLIIGLFVFAVHLLINSGPQPVYHIDGGGDYSNAVPNLYVDFLRQQQYNVEYPLSRSDICKYWDKDC